MKGYYIMNNDRLKKIKERARNIRTAKRTGINFLKIYQPGDIVYIKEYNKLGKVLEDQLSAIKIDFDGVVKMLDRSQFWGKERDDYLRNHYQTNSNQQLAEALNTDPKLIQWRLKALKLRRLCAWDEKKDRFIKENLHLTNAELAEKLGTTIASIKGRIHRLKSIGYIKQKNRRKFVWTKERDRYLVENIKKPKRVIAEELGTSYGSVKGRIRRLRKNGNLPSTKK